jgi:hypothetical protein
MLLNEELAVPLSEAHRAPLTPFPVLKRGSPHADQRDRGFGLGGWFEDEFDVQLDARGEADVLPADRFSSVEFGFQAIFSGPGPRASLASW